jgi:hypothetical protein
MLNFKQFLGEHNHWVALKAKGGLFMSASRDKVTKIKGRQVPRPKLFLDKIDNGEPFLTKKGKDIIIHKNAINYDELVDIMKRRDHKALDNFELSDGKRKFKLKDLAKTKEFGGQGSGTSTAVEDKALKQTQKNLQEVLDKHGVDYIYLKIGSRIEQVSGMRTEKGTPKSDFNFINLKGKDVFFISHKKYAGGKIGFQQYGGLPEAFKTLKSPDTQQFLEDAKAYYDKNYGGEVKKGTETWREVKDDAVWRVALFGKAYKSGATRDKNNVDGLFEGDLTFKKLKDIKGIPMFELIGQGHTILHGDKKPDGIYEPCYFIRVERGKHYYGIKEARTFIAPKGLFYKGPIAARKEAHL